MKNPYRFENKIVLVTGGNAGIGLAAAQAFAFEGAKVVIAARREAEGEAAVASIVEAGGEAMFVAADVSDEASAEAMVAACVSRYGGLDVAYNNAGIIGQPSVNILAADIAVFDRVMAINARGVWLSMKFEVAAMLERGGGAIVNCSSTAGASGGAGGNSAYYASKHAVIGMTKQVAAEFATQKIRVNAVLPGLTKTDLIAAFQSDPAKLERLSKRHSAEAGSGGGRGRSGSAVACGRRKQLCHRRRASGRWRPSDLDCRPSHKSPAETLADQR